LTGFLTRWGMAFSLVAATYNPTQWNYVDWTLNHYETDLAISVLSGLLLLVGYIIYVRATLRSIGLFGMGLVVAIILSGVWVLFDQGYLTLVNRDQIVWTGLAGLSFVLGIGLSWSHVRRLLSGQSDMDDLGD